MMRKTELQVNIELPAFPPGAKAGLLEAYTQALCAEIRGAAEELSEYQITQLNIFGAGNMRECDLNAIFVTLTHKLDLEHADICALLSPERLSTALMTAFRNFRVNHYRIDFGTLNILDFRQLGRSYTFRTYDFVKQILFAYDLHNFCCVLNLNIPGQNKASLLDSLNRVLELSPESVNLTPLPSDDPDQAEAMMDCGTAVLKEHGYEAIHIHEYALPLRADPFAASICREIQSWGFGAGGVSFLDGCVLKNTSDLGTYLKAAGDTEQIIMSAVRLTPDVVIKNRLLHYLHRPDGVAADEFADSFYPEVHDFLDGLCQKGFACEKEGRFLLTRRGTAMTPWIWKALSGLTIS